VQLLELQSLLVARTSFTKELARTTLEEKLKEDEYQLFRHIVSKLMQAQENFYLAQFVIRKFGCELCSPSETSMARLKRLVQYLHGRFTKVRWQTWLTITVLLTCLPHVSGAEYVLGLDYSTNETCSVEVIQAGISYGTFIATSIALAVMCFGLGMRCSRPSSTTGKTTSKTRAVLQARPPVVTRTVSTQSPCTYTWWWQNPQFKVLRTDDHGVGI